MSRASRLGFLRDSEGHRVPTRAAETCENPFDLVNPGPPPDAFVKAYTGDFPSSSSPMTDTPNSRPLMYDRRIDADDEDPLTGSQILERYLTLKADLEELAETVNSWKERALEVVTDEGGKVEGFLGCDLRTSIRESHEFPDEIQQEEKRLSALKAMLRKTGQATITKTSVVLTVTRSKTP